MSIKVMSEVWEHAPFVGTELLILLALADMANDDRECWPGQKHVAHKGRITIQQATSVLKNLEMQGVIEIIHRTVEGRGNISNLYRIKPVNQWDLLIEYDNTNPPQAGHTPLPKQGIPPSHKPTREIKKEPVLEPSLETNTPRKRDLVYDAIAETFNLTASGQIVSVREMMLGRAKRGTWKDCNFDPPVTDAQEITDFGVYMRGRILDMNRQNEKKGDPTRVTDISAPVTIQRWFYDFRASRDAEHPVTPTQPTEKELKMRSPAHDVDADVERWLREKEAQGELL